MSELVAQLNMKEFDPTKEKHHPLLIIKAVDPGCTLELQIEDAVSGEVVRITTTESESSDQEVMVAKIVAMFTRAWENFAAYGEEE